MTLTDLPEFLVSGDDARLFPVLADTSKEQRVASIFLAVMTQIPALAEEVLATVGVRVGKRTRVRAFTEVVFKDKSAAGCRPDGLIVVDTGRTTWTALVEAKIGGNDLEPDQVEKYVDVARSQGIDAVITISNQFASRADHSPVNVSKKKLRSVNLFHWSWAYLATSCEILEYQGVVDDREQSYLLDQLNDFLAHPATGVERFTQMPREWKQVVQDCTNAGALKKSSPDVESVAASWLAEERDLGLHLSSHISTKVDVIVERKLQDDPGGRLKKQVDSLVDTQTLNSVFRVPDCASDIAVCADMNRRTLSFSMTVKAPTDKKSTKARLNWLLRMLPETDERFVVRAHWPGRTKPNDRSVPVLREEPELIQTENTDLVPHSFEVLLVESNGQRFAGRKTVIQDIERLFQEFYDTVGANLKAWQPAPPKPVKSRTAPKPGEVEFEDLGPAGALPDDAQEQEQREK